MPDPVDPKDPVDPNNKPISRESFEEAIKTRDAAKERARAAEAELERLRTADQSRAALEAKAKEDAERARLEHEGKYQEALKNLESKYSQELESERKARLQILSNRVVPDAIRSAASRVSEKDPKVKLAPGVLDDLPRLLGNQVQVDPKTNDLIVVGEDGKPLVDEKLAPIPLDQFVLKYVQAKPYMLVSQMQTGTGLNPNNNGDQTPFTVDAALKDGKVLAAWKQADPAGCKAAFDEYARSGAQRARERLVGK